MGEELVNERARAQWQRLGDELEVLVTCLRLAADSQDPHAPRRVRAVLETALLLRPLVARLDEPTVLGRLERQVEFAGQWLAWRRQRMTSGIQGASTGEQAGGQALAALLPLLRGGLPAGAPASPWPWSSLLPLFLLLAGRGGTGTKTGEAGSAPLSSLLSLIGPALSGSLPQLSAFLPALFGKTEAHPATPSATQLPTQSASDQPPAPALGAAMSTLLPKAQELMANPQALGDLLRRAEEKLGKEKLARLEEMARRLAEEQGAPGAGVPGVPGESGT